ncbi:MAG: hypothetical protein ABGW85_01540, partial [Sulfurimonas sp.]
YKDTGAKLWLILLAIAGTFSAAGFAIYYTSEKIAHFGLYIVMAFVIAFTLEVLLRLFNERTIEKQIIKEIESELESLKERL